MTSLPKARHRNPPLATHLTGFTLVELLVTVAIVAILAAIAYPSYTDQVAKARRAEMEAELMSLAGFMERLYTESGCYNPGTGMDCSSPATPDIRAASNSYEYYVISIPSIGADSFVLQAKPTAGTAQAGDNVLCIDQRGKRWREDRGVEKCVIKDATE